MALRMLWPYLRAASQGHHHDHRMSAHRDDHSHAGNHHHGHTHATPEELARSYSGRTVTTAEVAWFGFTGGLLPCPAAIAVLLACLQLKAFTLGIAMVAAFSIGLAATLIAVGVAAAWGIRQAPARWGRFGRWPERLPLVSGILVLSIGVVFTWRGLVSV